MIFHNKVDRYFFSDPAAIGAQMFWERERLGEFCKRYVLLRFVIQVITWFVILFSEVLFHTSIRVCCRAMIFWRFIQK